MSDDARGQRYVTGSLGKGIRPRVVELDRLFVMHQEQVILHDISLSVYEGEAVAVLGAGGAGKTVLLACLQGLIQPARGHIHVLGSEIPPVAAVIRRQVGAMPVRLDQPPGATVADYVRRYAAAHDVLLRPAQVQEYARRYGLKAEERVIHLGQCQSRVLQLALALAHDPRLVLLDEPLAGLNEADGAVIWPYLQQMQREGRTLLISFSPPVADVFLREYDLIIKLEQGRIVQQETGKG